MPLQSRALDTDIFKLFLLPTSILVQEDIIFFIHEHWLLDVMDLARPNPRQIILPSSCCGSFGFFSFFFSFLGDEDPT